METEKKNNKGLIGLVVVLAIMVLGLSGYIVYDKVISNNNKNNGQTINQKDDNSGKEIEQQKNYNAYQVGDKVSLSDSSNWNVLVASTESDEFVTLLSIDNINNVNTKINFRNASNYISTTYKSSLITSLNADDSDIKEARLLTLEDISKLSGISVSELIPGKSLENGVTPAFLYQSTTITSSVDQDCPVMICEAVPEYHETNPGRVCIGTPSDALWGIRPVITVSKDYIR